MLERVCMAAKKPYSDTIKIENLLLDEGNPRHPTPLPPDDALLKFAEQPKTLKLAEHLSKNGPNPLDCRQFPARPVILSSTPGADQTVTAYPSAGVQARRGFGSKGISISE